MALGAAGAAAAVLPRTAEARDWTAGEKANVQVVNAFCAAWASSDPETITSFMAEDCTTRLSETQPPAKGRTALRDTIKGLFQRVQKVEIEVTETFAIGPTVLNDRIDYITREGQRAPIRVVGFFLVKDGKIAEWTDYLVRP
ncbi:MAG TPA: nuclear transport factor 2 family protein [Vicinamibacterales bacterium]